ncbi:MAG: S8 family serine peptidase [Thermoanaerobaculales bacterium]
MTDKLENIQDLIFGTKRDRRYTQDSPILPDVWLQFAADRKAPADLLLTPHRDVSAGHLAKTIRKRLKEERKKYNRRRRSPKIAFAQGSVVVHLYFDELIRVVLPMTPWWQRYVWKGTGEYLRQLAADSDATQYLAEALTAFERQDIKDNLPLSPDLLWMARIVGAIADPTKETENASEESEPLKHLKTVRKIQDLIEDLEVPDQNEEKLVWLAGLNREATTAVKKSTLAIKADAARRLFKVDCSSLTWAVVDSGVDARHSAFRAKKKDGSPWDIPTENDGTSWRNRTRVVATYDFNRVRTLLDPDNLTKSKLKELLPDIDEAQWAEVEDLLQGLRRSLQTGRDVDWDLLEPFLRVPHRDPSYKTPLNTHGTHVAGILAGDWEHPEGTNQPPLQGVCPDLRIYDLRVLDDSGRGDEFSVLAALQFIRYLNAHHDYFVIHGANLSLSIRHDVSNYACGRTPVCEECERVVNNGVVVVAAAGNLGMVKYRTLDGVLEGYNAISVTDPGNAESVITVGATHRYRPHSYGVSYFSSRGPTGDGRAKPDLVAPGEKITAPIPGEAKGRKDGTSMAAPHVSGAAAMLMARHKEFVGEASKIKRILCETATDLGRERYFQGSGMLDVLRALQSI